MGFFDSETKICHGTKVPPLYNPDQGLGQLILRIFELTPHEITQISADTGASVTCAEMRLRTLKIAAHLKKLGLKEGDVIGVIATNNEHVAPLVFACFLLGLPVNPLAPVMIESDIVQMFSNTKPKLILCDADRLKVVQNSVDLMKSDAKILTFMEMIDGYDSVSQILSQSEEIESFSCPDVDPNSTAMILCSSGSTSFPKGIQKSHKNFLTDLRPMPTYNPNGRSVMFLFSPIFWISGAHFLVFSTLHHHTRIVTRDVFSADLMAEIVEKYKVTIVFTPPYCLVNMLQKPDLRPFLSMKSWLIGGSAISKDLCEKFKPFIPNGELISCFGSTEQGIMMSNRDPAKFGSVGMPNDNVSVKVVDDDGNALPKGQKGEIYARTLSKFIGYFNERQKFEESYDGEWFKTGDVGYFDEDGHLYIAGRKKELMKFNNYQVTPSELEALINEIEGVVNSCVVGVLQEGTGNDIIHAFVIVEESSNLTEEFVLKYVNERVFDAKKLRGGVHFVKNFELGLTGKIDRNKMKKIAEKF